MSYSPMVLRSLVHHWRSHLAVALGVAVAAAVLTGALLVGDSMRGSLRRLALDRLGEVDQALVADRFFRSALAEELASAPDFPRQSAAAVPAILLHGNLERIGSNPAVRANQVNIIGCDGQFWQLGIGGPDHAPGPGEIVLNQALADQLGATQGDEVGLRLPRRGAIPAESALGQKQEQRNLAVVQLRVSEVIPTEGLGRFGLRPTQRLPRNAYVPLGLLQQQLRENGRVNAILVRQAFQPDISRQPGAGQSDVRLESLTYQLHPTLDDYGIHVQGTRLGYVNVTSDRMVLEPAAERAIVDALAARHVEFQPALTYLANTIACGKREVPYSTITAVGFAAQPRLGPFLSPEGKPLSPLADDEVALNSWAAEDLRAKPGDTIRVSYFEPESTHGQVREKTVELRLAVIVDLKGAADDRDFTPTVRGLTDKASLDDWDPPFPFERKRIRPEDEKYWARHRATPKAFVSLATGRRLWGSRFGQTTSIRVEPAQGITADSLERELKIEPAAMGFVLQPVRQQALAAAKGTTPFNVLFLSFSSFIIAAAVMLVALLFRLGIERRSPEAGILLATGFRRRQVTRLFSLEGLVVAAFGSLLGVAGGMGYAASMLAGLRTWWLAAVSTPFLRLHVTSMSLLIGYGSGLLVAFAAIVWSARRLGRIAPRRLLAGDCGSGVPPAGGKMATTSDRRKRRHVPSMEVAWLLVLAASVALGLSGLIPASLEVGVFFGSGVLVLAMTLAVVRQRFRQGATGPAVAVGRGNLLRLALRNAARNPGRSSLTIGLMASATFLIAAISAFRIDPAQQTPTFNSGNGGFSLVAESDQPIYRDLNTRQGRKELDFSPEDEALLAQCTIYSLRVKPGDDASCLNLFRPRQPRLLGVPVSLIERGGFAWADASRGEENPWQSLASGPPHVPVVLDKNTANYSLNLWKGRGEHYEMTDSRGRTLDLEVAGLLSNSIFQGDLLVSEEALLGYDPDVSGYRFFLIESPAERTEEVRAALERTLGDYGFAAETTADRLAGFLAVQNTYLSTFQSLGGLGLLLGTLGLAAVQLRNVLERRGELALLRATGFRQAMLARMIMLENVVVLALGLAAGMVAAVVAVLPHLLGRGASIPWTAIGGILAAVLAVGILAGLAAVRAVAAVPLLTALREER